MSLSIRLYEDALWTELCIKGDRLWLMKNWGSAYETHQVLIDDLVTFEVHRPRITSETMTVDLVLRPSSGVEKFSFSFSKHYFPFGDSDHRVDQWQVLRTFVRDELVGFDMQDDRWD